MNYLTALLLLCRVKLEDINHNLQDEDVRALAAASHGYVGADLAAMCQEAAMCALRRVVRHRQRSESTTEASGDASDDPDAPPPDLLKVCFICSFVTSKTIQTFNLQLCEVLKYLGKTSSFCRITGVFRCAHIFETHFSAILSRVYPTYIEEGTI